MTLITIIWLMQKVICLLGKDIAKINEHMN